MTRIGSLVGFPVGDPPAGSTVTAIASPACMAPFSCAVVVPCAASNTPAETGVLPRTNHSS